MNSRSFTIGTDIEFGMTDKQRKLRSAIPFINGTKHDPQILEDGTHLSFDNVNVEFATTVARSMNTFKKAIQSSFTHTIKALPVGHNLLVTASNTYPDKELETDDAMQFGCDPDYDAWTGLENPIPDLDTNPNQRVCGGHVHIGCVKGYDHLLTDGGKALTVQVLDAVLALPLVLLEDPVNGRARRQLYGKAGAHRPKDYGVEYRVLSNFWSKSPTTCQLVYALTNCALNIIADGKAFELINMIGVQNIVDTINDCDVFKAKRFLKSVLIAENYLDKKSMALIKKAENRRTSIKARSIEHNWNIDLATATA